MWNSIPEELKSMPMWAIAGPEKAPYRINGQRANVIDPSTWTDFYSACSVAQQWGAQIGFVLSEADPFSCIDLDVKDTTTQEELDRYWKIIQSFDSYSEYSKSGKGVHIWIKGDIGQGCRRDGVEVYSKQRFIICTGNALEGFYKPIEWRQELLEVLASEIRSKEEKATKLKEVDQLKTDGEILQMAFEAENGQKFRDLWQGFWKKYRYPSQSEADLSLLSMLCFYTKSNEQVRRLFRQSILGKRAKARNDNRYIDRTLALVRGRQEREDIVFNEMKEGVVNLINAADNTLIEADGRITNGIEYPPGIVGSLARWFYSISPRPVKEVAIVSALAVMSGVYGRAYNISGSGLNLYIVLVARSAIGKEAIHSNISKLTHTMLNNGVASFSSFIDFNDYASGPALMKACAGSASGSFLNIAGEWGRKMRRMGSDYSEGAMATLRTVMTNLYQKSSVGTIVGGIGYSDKDKNVSSVNGVAYSMIGETTPETFYESLTNTMMQDGFMSRFLIVSYSGYRPELNENISHEIPEDVCNTLINGVQKVMSCPVGQSYEVNIEPNARTALSDFDKECDKQINATDDESYRQMWNRAHLKALKLSALIAVADNPIRPLVTIEHVKWALRLIKMDIRTMTNKLASGDVGDGDIARELKVLDVCRNYLTTPLPPGYRVPDSLRKAAVIPRKVIVAKTQRTNSFINHKLGAIRALDMTLQSLCDSGYIIEVPKDRIKEEWQGNGKLFRIVNLPEVG